MLSFLKKSISLFCLIFLMGNCSPDKTQSNSNHKNPLAVQTAISNNQFKDYWYQGKAELTSYDLEQARYRDIHQGDAVLIFVTEDFSKKKQVKLDYPSKNPKDAVPILKLNSTRKFNTGIYPYSCLLYTSPSPRDQRGSRMPSSA